MTKLSEDRETIPQGVQNAEQRSSEGREVDESSGSMREKANGEAGSDSEGNHGNNYLESSPQEMDQAHEESSSLDDVGNAEISEDEPLSKWKRPSGRKVQAKSGEEFSCNILVFSIQI
ncbi:uncharacterized protein LOC114741173 [Neltuma alba]|uniref:uncharacterized protein LOC114741173 n=1 Tax=Neltuma alba TaxID=207710 RepID=UPI0010A2BEDF|nr:uncharacterized protein LOC114741173 [Prosopis alba]